jgi:hypothetical protein
MHTSREEETLHVKIYFDRCPTASKNQFYLALIYSLSILVAGDVSVDGESASCNEYIITLPVKKCTDIRSGTD